MACMCRASLCTQVRAALVAAFGADATAKLGPLIEKFDSAVKAAGGVEALAAQATSTLNQLLPGAGDAVGGLLGAAGGLLGGLNLGGGEEEEGGSGSRGLGSALFGVALNILMDPNMMQTVSVGLVLQLTAMNHVMYGLGLCLRGDVEWCQSVGAGGATAAMCCEVLSDVCVRHGCCPRPCCRVALRPLLPIDRRNRHACSNSNTVRALVRFQQASCIRF